MIAASYEGKLYGHLKGDTAAVVVAALGPIRDETQRLLDDPGELERILTRGADKARARAAVTLDAVRERLGFVRRS